MKLKTTPIHTPSIIFRPAFAGALLGLLALCIAPASSAADGWATSGGSVTGGAGGPTVTVSTLSEFTANATDDTPRIVQINGTINLGSSNFDVGSNKTFIGLGSNSGFNGNPRVQNKTNVIFENLNFTNPSPGVGNGDGLSIDTSTRIFVTRCSFVECHDGSLDFRRGADYITVSWCKFSYNLANGHNFVNLVSSSPNDGEWDRGKLRITFHHNWYSTLCTERMPLVRFGKIHFYNNYINSPNNNYVVEASRESEVLVENNHFENIEDPFIITNITPRGKIKALGSKFVNCTKITSHNDTVFAPPYSYTLDPVDNVKSLVSAGAGAGGGTPPPPPPPGGEQQWLEAEGASGQSNFSPFAVLSDAAASGGSYIATTVSSTGSAPANGHATFNCTLSGTVAIWLRIYFPSGSADSFWTKYGTESFANFFDNTSYGTWRWVKWGERTATGNNDFVVAYREAGARLDRVLFSTDLAFTPTGTGPGEPPSGGEEWLQAEGASGQSNFSPFAVLSDSGASGGSYIATTVSSTGSAPSNGHATFNCTLSGTVAIWLRIYFPSGSADSFWIKYGTESFANFFDNTSYGTWRWVKWGERSATGNNDFVVAYREANSRLDRVLFTTDLAFTPTGTGP